MSKLFKFSKFVKNIGAMDCTDKYTCNICSVVLPLHMMYACYHGHYLCRKCYKQMYYKGKEKKCPHGACNSYMVKSADIAKGEPMERSLSMFPNPSIYSQPQMNLHTNMSLTSLPSACRPSCTNMNVSLSKKPLRCPHHGCHKTIAVSALNSHFERDHKHVVSIVTQLEVRNSMEFNFREFHAHVKSLCLLLVHVEAEGNRFGHGEIIPSGGEKIIRQRSCFSRTSTTNFIQPQPFFIAMTAKMSANDFNAFGDNDEEEPDECDLSSSHRIIFYVSSNIPTTYSYTIALSSPDQSIRVKYFGPLLPIGEDYKKLCEEGKGLILNRNHVIVMSDRGTRNVCVDIVFHERGEDPFESD